MSLVVLTDITGASVAINPNLVQGVTLAPGVTPTACFVRCSGGESFVIPGSVAAVSSALAGAAAAGAVTLAVKGSSGVILSQSESADALGITSQRLSAGVYELTITVGTGFPLGTMAPMVSPFQLGARMASGVNIDALTIHLLTFDDAGVAADADVYVNYITGLNVVP